jgi:hypothetical protein
MSTENRPVESRHRATAQAILKLLHAWVTPDTAQHWVAEIAQAVANAEPYQPPTVGEEEVEEAIRRLQAAFTPASYRSKAANTLISAYRSLQAKLAERGKGN